MADESEALPSETTLLNCSHCDKTGRFMKLCSQCRAVLYCSRECQAKDWPCHKKLCSKVQNKTDTETALGGFISESKILEEKKKVKENHSNESEVMNDEKQLEQQLKYSKNIERKQETPQNNGKILSPSSKELEKESPTENSSSSRTNISLNRNMNDESKRISQRNGDKIIITIFIKHNKEKRTFEVVKDPDDSNSTFQQISDFLRIPVGNLKLIHKGEMVVPENVNTFLNHGALFLAFGEVSECEDGLNKTDIDLLIKQLNVDRNVAVKALRRTGTLLDAIFDIGNKL